MLRMENRTAIKGATMTHQQFKERLEEIAVTVETEDGEFLAIDIESPELITLFEDYTKAIVGEEEPLSSLDEWLEATKNYGGTEEEWWKLHSMHNTEENLRQTIKQTSKTILKGESDEL